MFLSTNHNSVNSIENSTQLIEFSHSFTFFVINGILDVASDIYEALLPGAVGAGGCGARGVSGAGATHVEPVRRRDRDPADHLGGDGARPLHDIQRGDREQR